QPAMVQAMAKPFRTLFERQTGIRGDVIIHSTATDMATKLKNAELQLGVFHGFEFARAKAADPDLEPVVVSIPPSRVLQACVIVHIDRKGNCLNDLGTDTISAPRGLKAHCFAYIERAQCNLGANIARIQTRANQTAEDVLNNVADGILPAAVVDYGAFLAYEKLQPGVSKKLRILCKSETFPWSVIATRKGQLPPDVLAKVRTGLLSAADTPQGKPLMMLWNLKGFGDVPADYDLQLTNILKDYPAIK
ncbi:MAG: phosphate/phosphite/phosphonate ABC transporter substrate-binding protein, partial [Gemmataceae bacterium]